MPFLRKTLKRGMTMVFRGRMIIKNNQRAIEQPEIYTPAAYEQKLHSMQPIYSLTAGLTNQMITKMVREVLENLDLNRDYLPEELRVRNGLAEYNFAIQQIHFPKDQDTFIPASKRLAFAEVLFFILALHILK